MSSQTWLLETNQQSKPMIDEYNLSNTLNSYDVVEISPLIFVGMFKDMNAEALKRFQQSHTFTGHNVNT